MFIQKLSTFVKHQFGNEHLNQTPNFVGTSRIAYCITSSHLLSANHLRVISETSGTFNTLHYVPSPHLPATGYAQATVNHRGSINLATPQEINVFQESTKIYSIVTGSPGQLFFHQNVSTACSVQGHLLNRCLPCRSTVVMLYY